MILGPQSKEDDVVKLAGGKGANLWRLTQMKMPVPGFFVIGADVFDAFVAANGIVPGPEAHESILRGSMPPDLAATITSAWRTLGATEVAVRSSALAEDSAKHSFAGQLQSFMYICSESALLRAVVGCWASAFTQHAVAYMKQHRVPIEQTRVAVVVQEMVHADVSGVAFTVEPLGGNPDHMMVSAVLGLGEGLVSGLLDSDDFVLDKRTQETVQVTLCTKEVRLVRKAEGGLQEESVPAPLQSAPSLTDAQLAQLGKCCVEVERNYGRPQDIEWAFAKGTLHILQARPITTPTARKPIQIWDNSNIIESYSGVTSPMTFTFARNAYHHVYVQFCQVMGVPPAVVAASDNVLRNMLGYLDGRIYYNLLNWYHLIGLFPGFKNNKSYMEGMMGVRETLPADAQKLLQLPPSATVGDKLRQRWLGVKMVFRFLKLNRTVTEFQRYFAEHYERYRHASLDGKSVEELLELNAELEGIFLARWRVPITNDFFAMVFFGLLRKLTQDWNVDKTGALQNDLLCGEGGVESAVPTEQLIGMAATISGNPEWRSAFLASSPEQLEVMVSSEIRFRPLFREIEKYVDAFGFRCMNELKLEEPDLHKNPRFIYTALKNYVEHAPPAVAELRAREQDIRQRAEAKVRESLHGPRRLFYNWVLKHARRTVKNRENLRFARTKVFGLGRRMLDAGGEDLVRRGILESPQDIYMLQLDELHNSVHGALTTRNFKALVALRKEEQKEFHTRNPDDRIVTRGLVYHGNSYEKRAAAPTHADGILRGVACCPGRVNAAAKVIRNPQDDMALAGDILVAQRTDPGWTPLFPSASGILVERGSLLSHSAIVARELGIPCVVGIAGLTRLVKTGDSMEMDGAEGWARIKAVTGGVAS